MPFCFIIISGNTDSVTFFETNSSSKYKIFKVIYSIMILRSVFLLEGGVCFVYKRLLYSLLSVVDEVFLLLF